MHSTSGITSPSGIPLIIKSPIARETADTSLASTSPDAMNAYAIAFSIFVISNSAMRPSRFLIFVIFIP